MTSSQPTTISTSSSSSSDTASISSSPAFSSPAVTASPIVSASATAASRGGRGGSTSTSAAAQASISAAGAASATKSASGVPAAAIAVPVLLGVLALLALNFLWVRKRYIRNRQKKSGAWAGANHSNNAFGPATTTTAPGLEAYFAGAEKAAEAAAAAAADADAPAMRSPAAPVSAPVYAAFTTSAPAPVPQPPAPSYNNPPAPMSPPTLPAAIPAILRPGSPAASLRSTPPAPQPPATPSAFGVPVPATTAAASAVVRCTFIPTLPDELQIATGERVRVLAEYDDGWGLCQNARGEQGMVPLECLQREGGAHGAAQGDWRNSRRASSLRGGV
jgi:hypothetical protein